MTDVREEVRTPVSILAVQRGEGVTVNTHSRNSGKPAKRCARRRAAGSLGRARGLTGGLDKLRVGVVRDQGDREIPEVELQRAGDDVDVFVHVHRNICFLTIWEGC